MEQAERDRLIRLEEQMKAFQKHVDGRFDHLDGKLEDRATAHQNVKTVVDALQKQSFFARVGFVIVLSVGGFLTWILSVADKAKGLLK